MEYNKIFQRPKFKIISKKYHNKDNKNLSSIKKITIKIKEIKVSIKYIT